MYVLYEDSGNFKAEKIFSEAESSLQVEAATGRRSKIKRANVLFSFDRPEAAQLLEQAHALAETIDIPFLWECAPQEDFAATDFAEDYFGHPPDAVEKAGLIFALHNAPVYFHRRGKGQYRAAPPDILKAALAAVEKKRQQEARQQEWTDQLVAGQLPEAIANQAQALLLKPDKNTLEFKAFDAAVRQLGTSPEQLLLDLGAWPNVLALHRQRFFSQHFPKGTGFPDIAIEPNGTDLPLADVIAYSVDDADTTEVDDALSVTHEADGVVRLGVHIAAPGLLVTRGSQLDELARARMSTVYLPGQKIPMFPDALISACSLDAGLSRPVVSLYTRIAPDGEVLDIETRLEQIVVKENLRYDLLCDQVSEEALNDPAAPLPYGDWLRPLWAHACRLRAERDELRGKPENNQRVEYSFHLEGPPDNPDSLIRLVPRQRNSPLDLLIAEYMIYANNQWGGLLAKHGVPGVYRSQQAGRVRMSTHPLPHEAIGVPQYIWGTSPLRRYIDLLNQWQIIAAVQHGVSARLVAPFKPKEADLFAIVSAFEAQYSTWSEFQRAMERYWCLRWLQQQGLQQVQASVIRDDLLRLDCAPLVTKVTSLPSLEKGQQVTLDIMGYDELGLELDCRFVSAEPLGDTPDANADPGKPDDSDAPDGSETNAAGDT